jgi:DNA repair exonuclease SbcCD ATPase subunit
MITFKELRWSNAFSYGTDNTVTLNGSPLTQIVGKNGHGKSSIALIIEEVLYNQNSKKIKKADILNRYTKDKNYTIELDFAKDGVEYCVKTTRTSTSSTVKLYRDGTDISNHTATGTYKAIEYIIGYDHKTFSQIVYQSSVGSLEFLTATDTARKKFLIDLLNLNIYTKASDVFKSLASDTNKTVDAIQTKIGTIESWIKKYQNFDLTPKQPVDEPTPPTELVSELNTKTNELKNIETTNKKVITNNKYKELLSKIKIGAAPSEPPTSDKINSLKVDLAVLKKELQEGGKLAEKCSQPISTCVTCKQTIDNTTMYSMAEDFRNNRRPELEKEILKLTVFIKDAETRVSDWKAHNDKVLEIEKYHALIDTDISEKLTDKDLLIEEINNLEEVINSINTSISNARTLNKTIAEHNSKISVVSEQMDSMKKDLKELNSDLVVKVAELTNLQVLVKAFSTTGLVAYKIECLVKDLESLTNEYLAELADGRFQISFKITSSDKLNVVVTDNGNDIDIIALSSGERARVNVCTLLAIRKLMQSLSNSRTNLLILDETVENLDAEGKEKLIEVLLKEENLNTFLISHGFSHPLLEKLQVTKAKNMSRIEA